MPGMKQLLLRVPEELHSRLAARAASEGRSVNALATEILDLAAAADPRDRQSRLRAKAASSGLLCPAHHASSVSEAKRRRVIASTRGLGKLADQLLDDERDRL
jgi:plasmid stability protein